MDINEAYEQLKKKPRHVLTWSSSVLHRGSISQAGILNRMRDIAIKERIPWNRKMVRDYVSLYFTVIAQAMMEGYVVRVPRLGKLQLTVSKKEWLQNSFTGAKVIEPVPKPEMQMLPSFKRRVRDMYHKGKIPMKFSLYVKPCAFLDRLAHAVHMKREIHRLLETEDEIDEVRHDITIEE